jgi:ABC-type microcin C transport system duplicated ATPase subunit YejF
LLEPGIMSLLELDNLSKTYPGGVRAVSEVSLTIEAGEVLGVVGESGCGKSTLGRTLLRLIEPSGGSIHFEGRDLTKLSRHDMKAVRRDLQVIFQDPFGSLNPRHTVGYIIAEPLVVHHVGDRQARARRVAELLNIVGLPEDAAGRYPHEFSGGQRQRIAIARAMVLKPQFVMLDEPTSALDMSVQAQVVDLLRDLQAKHSLAYLFISHDLKVVRALANDMIVMRLGKVVEQGPSERIFTAPQEDYTKALMAAAFNMEAVDAAAIRQ